MLDAIVAADNKTGPHKVKHNKNKNAKYGIYKYNTKLAFPVKDAAGKTTGYNVYSAQMIVNHASNGNLELYDIIDINKDDQSALKLLNESARGTIKMLRQPKVASQATITQNNQNGKTRKSMAELDAEYEKAVNTGNMARAEEMLLEKLQQTEGITAFNAPEWYSGEHKDIARMIKEGTPEVIARAAGEMAQYVPDNAVLIPMPPHEGKVTDDTDTMILAKAISEMTGRPVVNALESDERESRYKAKAENRKGLTAEEMGFRQIAEIPEGTMPIFIDNVVGSGETAKAARNALGGGITLSYAKSVRSQGIEGLKRATVTYDKDGNLIPLSQRFDISKRDVKYSRAQLNGKTMGTVLFVSDAVFLKHRFRQNGDAGEAGEDDGQEGTQDGPQQLQRVCQQA